MKKQHKTNILTMEMLSEYHSRRVIHSQFKEGEELLEDLFDLSPDLRHAYIATVFADFGLGKSTLFADHITRHPPTEIETKKGLFRLIPSVVVAAEEKCTVRKLVDSLCRALDVSVTTSDNADYLKAKAKEALVYRGTKVLGIDEAQEFLTNSNSSGVRSVVSFVRSLAESTKIPIVLLGTNDYESFVYHSGDISSRVKREFHMRVMDSPIDDETEFYWLTHGMLENLKDVTGRSLSTDWEPLDFAQRLFLVTGGRIRCVHDFFAQYIFDQAKSKSTKASIGKDECLKVLKKYRPPFPLIKPSSEAYELKPKELYGLMEKFEFMDDHV